MSQTIERIQFGAWLRNEIDERLWTVTAFAARLGVSRSQAKQWLASRNRPHPVQVVRLGRCLNIPRRRIDEILDATFGRSEPDGHAGHRAAS